MLPPPYRLLTPTIAPTAEPTAEPTVEPTAILSDFRYYITEDDNGYRITLEYKDVKILEIQLKSLNDIEIVSAPSETTAPDAETLPKTGVDDDDVDGTIRDEFKAAMDSYEAFIDDYISFMEKYNANSSNDLAALVDYANYVSKYADAVDSLEKWQSEGLSDAETAYYVDVQIRANQKLQELAQD